jgi:ring-1,2-phenylacetyl-CoA epoxidase subunit PaaE
VAEQTFHTLTVARVEPETDSAVKITFQVPPESRDQFRFRQGQYLTLESEIDGERVRRSYSICSAVSDDQLQIAIKRVDDGVFSNFACDTLAPGQKLAVMPPQGNFFTPLDPNSRRNYLFIAAGSGITPVISNIRTILQAEPDSEVTLLLGNQRTSSIMFRESLGFLKNRYMSRFQWINFLSREDQGPKILNGRLDNRKGGELNRQLVRLRSFDEYFICGPESMISEVSRGLRSVGVDQARIHYELFGSSAEDARATVEKHLARARKYSGKVCQVTLIADGRTNRFELPADGENLLDAGINHGLDLPFSCKDGVCATCKARLLEGQVEMDRSHGLEPQDIANGIILTCQSHPISDSVVLDFDQA